MPPPDTPSRACPLLAVSSSAWPRSGYCRCRDLPRLLPLWPNDSWLENDVPENGLPRSQQPAKTSGCNGSAPQRLLGRLRRALRAERQRGIAGHWTYDLSRHAQLRNALDCEEALACRPAAETTGLMTCDMPEGRMPANCPTAHVRLKQIRNA